MITAGVRTQYNSVRGLRLDLEQIIDFRRYPIRDLDGFGLNCATQLDTSGSLLLPDFINNSAVELLKQESLTHKHLAYYCQQTHTAYLSATDCTYGSCHPRNRQVISSKGCITDDQIPESSLLRVIYDHPVFQKFL